MIGYEKKGNYVNQLRKKEGYSQVYMDEARQWKGCMETAIMDYVIVSRN